MHCSSILCLNLRCSLGLLFIFMHFGVMGFPQPSPSPSSTDSSPSSEHTCPVSTDKSKPLRYHVLSGKCYRIKSKGPCQNNLIFYSTGDGKTYGDCDCPLTGSDIPWVYHEQTNQCYQTFQQGYCSAGEWLVFDEETPQCVKNKCSAQIATASLDTKIVLFNDECVKLFESSPLCQTNEIVSFDPADVNPSCIKGEPADYNIAKTSQLKCKPGTRRDIVGKCRTAIQTQSAFMKIGR